MAQMYVFPYKAACMCDKLLSWLWTEMLSRSYIPSLWSLICAGCWRSQESTDKPCPQSYKSIGSKAEWDVHFKKQVPSSSGGECLCAGVDRVAGPRRLPEKGFEDENEVQEGQGRDKTIEELLTQTTQSWDRWWEVRLPIGTHCVPLVTRM